MERNEFVLHSTGATESNIRSEFKKKKKKARDQLAVRTNPWWIRAVVICFC